jgi:hypothetical protein
MRSDTSDPRLVPRRELDQETGEATVNYYWDGELAPKAEITGKLAEQLNGYSLIKKDLDSALKWVRLAESLIKDLKTADGENGYFQITDRVSGDTIKALFVASLTFYGKCFTSAAGRRTQASRDWLDAQHREVHDFYMNYRHNFAAHSGNERLEFAKTYVLVSPDGQTLIPYLPTARLQPDLALPGEGDPGLAELIEYVGERVVERYNRVAQKIVDELVLPKGSGFWRAAASGKEPVELELPVKNKQV